MPTHFVFVMAMLSLPVVTPSSGAASAASTAVPRFERAACPVDIVPEERIDCGVLIVPEHRRKADTRAIRLPVMIFRSRATTPAADPILFMPGGPGGSAVANRRSGKGNKLLDDRDYIVLEPRPRP